ncbi:hypothetical protein OSB04_014999 [Centaurea solstitialis]|uniref:Zinc finger PHD-type domain-containing protein n=1 Tax=Centaurea solstitialis TaxID=347529 RepID=A0AA38WIA7_9ASTR|nr:hypothetical protein OSB04_014999 [Centaurea solstitialis]
MGDIKHFSHEEHPLKLIENWETVVDDTGEKREVVCCYGCREPILGGLVYGCTPCSQFLHEKCANLAPVINHHLHPMHPLMLVARNISAWTCDVCDTRGLENGFSYWCSSCDFDACTKCGIATVLREEASIKFKHEGHPKHTLTLQSRSASFCCDACQAKDEDFFYQCDTCDFWMHKTCASLAHTIDLPHHPNHPLVLVYSLPDNFYNFRYYCEFCGKLILKNGWLYHCANCRYFSHIKCALNAEKPSIPSDSLGTSPLEDHINEFLHFPMIDAFTDPLKLLHLEKASLDDNGATEISHWSHDHPLILNVEPQGNNTPNLGCGDPIEVCYGCIRQLSLP